MKKNKKLSLARGLMYIKCNGYSDSYNRNKLQNRDITFGWLVSKKASRGWDAFLILV